MVAEFAAFAVEKILLANLAARELELVEKCLCRLIRAPALRTNAAEQTLTENGFEGGGNQERLDPHIDQTRDRAGRVVCVQGGENQMPRERSLDRDLRRLQIARLADHDAVRILAQERAEDARERQPDRFIHRHLNDPFQIVLDRLFRGQEFRIDRVDLAQTGIKRRCFSRAGGAGDDEDAVRTLDHIENEIVDVIGHAERAEIEVHGRAIEHAQDDALAELRRQSGDAHVDHAAGDVLLNAAVLREPALGDVHVRHHLHA